jgi:hypothetical protein
MLRDSSRSKEARDKSRTKVLHPYKVLEESSNLADTRDESRAYCPELLRSSSGGILFIIK